MEQIVAEQRVDIDRILGKIEKTLNFHRIKIIPNDGSYIESAVLVPLILRGDGLRIVFTHRTNELPHHRGQISFPGGKVDPGDKGLLDTVFREVQEEIGIGRDSIRILGRLDDELTRVSNFLIHPFVGGLWGDPPFFLNKDEVQRIIEVPLSFFLKESPKELSFAYEGITLQVQAYEFEGIVIWGATFRILSKFLSLILGLL